MSIKIAYDNVLSDNIGREGISLSDIQAFSGREDKILASIKEKKPGFMELPLDNKVVKDIEEYVEEKKGDIDNFVVLGIGGSALGNISLHRALNHPFYNDLSKEQRGGYPRIFVLDNVDPDIQEYLLDVLDPCKTLFNVITKSGSTAETMANFLFFLDKVKKRCDNYKDHFVATTTIGKGILWDIAQSENFKVFGIPENVGGRFSVLSPVGLLSARFSGIDIRELLRGAQDAESKVEIPNVINNPAFLLATIYYLLFTKRNKNISVLMPYSDRLYEISFWYRQLLAESIGKRYSLDGKEVFVGVTPVVARGTTDQHSQVQLYVEGPFDKFITFMRIDKFEKEGKLYNTLENEALSYFEGHSLSELINYEQIATEYVLTKAGRPNLTISFSDLSPYNLGMMYQIFEMQIAIMGELFNINAFDQPGVEEGKKLTYGLMGRKGFEDYKEKIKDIKERFSLSI